MKGISFVVGKNLHETNSLFGARAKIRKRIRDFHGLCLSGTNDVPIVRYIEVPVTSTGHRHHRHQRDIEGEDLEIGAVDKLLVGELAG